MLFSQTKVDNYSRLATSNLPRMAAQ